METLESTIGHSLLKGLYGLPQDYTTEDLWNFRSYRLNTRRLRKKFYKNPRRYLSKKVRFRLLAIEFSKSITDVMGRESFARRLFDVVEA